MGDNLGKTLIGLGLAIAFVGLLILLGGKLTWLKLGRLPGDISIHRDGFSLYFPIVTMLLISAVISAVMIVIGKLRR